MRSKSHPDCNNVAELSNILAEENSGTVWLTARDSASTTVLTAQIKVAKIARIEIASRFRQVSRGDTLHLQVRAYDAEGNVFSSVDGLRFDWEVKAGHDNIRQLPFKDLLHAKAHGHTHVDETAGEEGDDFLIKAVEAGKADVTVRILARGYEHINQANMTLTIVDPFVIVATDDFFEGPTPFSPVSILSTSSFNFKLRYVKQ